MLWGTLVYDPIAHWVWGEGGWLLEMGALDFAGGTVVHMSSGFSALVLAIVIGKRVDYGKLPIYPNNLVFTALGGGLLWFGWYGFNAGSALSAGTSAASAFATTHIAAAAGMVSWVLAEWWFRKQPSVLGAASGSSGWTGDHYSGCGICLSHGGFGYGIDRRCCLLWCCFAERKDGL